MIKGLEISGIRGIKKGRLDNLAPFTILVGPNGAGKSTVLDTLLIGSCQPVGDAVGRAVSRRSLSAHTARDFFYARDTPAKISVWGTVERTCELTWQAQPDQSIRERLEYQKKWYPFSQISCNVVDQKSKSQSSRTGFGNDNSYVYEYDGGPVEYVSTRLLDTTQDLPLDRLYSDLVQQGRRREMKKMLQEVIPHLDDIELLTDENNRPSLFLVDENEKAVPMALAGDGLVGFARLGFTLLTRSEKLMLIEEPEVHQHPACIEKTAIALRNAVRQGMQMVLTTHSLDLIDYLLDGANEDDLGKMKLFKLVLKDNELLSSYLDGPEIKQERQTIEEELR